MITETSLYWFTRLSHIHEFVNNLFTPFMALTILSFLTLMIVSIIEKISDITTDTDDKIFLSTICKMAKKTGCIAVGIVSITMICSIFVPTTKEMAAIVVIPKIANNESIKGLGDEIVNLAKEWMKEIHPSKIIADSKNK